MTDWYREPGWDDAAREAFEARLRRARPSSRPQYLRIKGTYLEGAGLDEAAEGLWRRVLRDHVGDLDAVCAGEQLGDLCARRGRYAEAEGLYRDVLLAAPDGSGTTGLVPVSLAQVLFRQGRADEAQRVLGDVELDELVMTSALFRFATVRAEVSDALDQPDAAAADAAWALALAEQPSQFTRHPGVGVVQLDAALRARLEMLAQG